MPADPIASASSAFWAKKQSASASTTASSHNFPISSDDVFNAIFSLFDTGTDSSEPFTRQSTDRPDTDADEGSAEDYYAEAPDDGASEETASIDAGLWQWPSSSSSATHNNNMVRPRGKKTLAGGGGLDLDLDGEADLSLALFDAETGELNGPLLMLLALLLAVAAMLASFVRSWVLLISAMRHCRGGGGGSGAISGGHVLIPVTVTRNSRTVQGHMLLPADHAGDEKGAAANAGGKGDALWYCTPSAAPEVEEGLEHDQEEAPTVEMASDYVVDDDDRETNPLLRRLL